MRKRTQHGDEFRICRSIESVILCGVKGNPWDGSKEQELGRRQDLKWEIRYHALGRVKREWIVDLLKAPRRGSSVLNKVSCHEKIILRIVTSHGKNRAPKS